MATQCVEVDRTPILEAACRVYHVERLDLYGTLTDHELEFVVSYEPDFSMPWLSHVTELKHVLEAIYRRPVGLSMDGSPEANRLESFEAGRRVALYEV